MLMFNSRFYYKIYYYRVEGVYFSMWVDGMRWCCEGPYKERRQAQILDFDLHILKFDPSLYTFLYKVFKLT